MKKEYLKFIETVMAFFFSRRDCLDTFRKLEFNSKPVSADKDVIES